MDTLYSQKKKVGSSELENYLHRRLKDYHLSLEWFRYDQEVIKVFNEISEDDISKFISQEELNEYIRFYILKNLVPNSKKLSDLYLDSLLKELQEKSKEYPDLEYDKNLLKRKILGVFKLISLQEKEYFENLNFEDKEIKELLLKFSLDFTLISKNFQLEKEINLFYISQRSKSIKKEIEKKKQNTQEIIDLFDKIVLASGNSDKQIMLIKAGIDLYQYRDDYVDISPITNLPVCNYLIEIAEEMAWEIYQRD